MDYKDIFATKLVYLREKHNLTQQQLADELQITRQSLSLYEKAERTINIDLLSKIADVFKVSTDYLLGRSEAATMNEDIKIACNVTGLSEKAVNKLQFINNNQETYTPTRINCLHSELVSGVGFFVFNVPSAIDIISQLIESRLFEIMIGDIQIYSAMSYENNNMIKIDEEQYNEIKDNPISSTYNYYITPAIIAETKLNHASDCVKKMIINIINKKEVSDNAKHNPPKE